MQRYKVEPYVVAADIYAVTPHVGRGGWTWYTGSAGWMQRAGIESILGLNLQGDMLHLDPCIPKAWPLLRTIASAWVGGAMKYEWKNPDGVERGIAFASLHGTVIIERPLRLGLTKGQRHISVTRPAGAYRDCVVSEA